MGKRGPAPAPTALKKLQGNPGKRPLNQNEPKPDNGKPQCPSWLSYAAKRQWKRIATPLHEAGLLTSIDGTGLAMLCETYASFIEARADVLARGQLLFNDDGTPYANPSLWQMNKARVELLKWLREFGMTPSSRSTIKLPGDAGQEKSLADQLFEAING